MQFLCYFLHVFLFSLCTEEKKLERAVFNFPVQIKLFSGRQLDVARKIEIVGRTGFVSMRWDGGEWVARLKMYSGVQTATAWMESLSQPSI